MLLILFYLPGFSSVFQVLKRHIGFLAGSILFWLYEHSGESTSSVSANLKWIKNDCKSRRSGAYSWYWQHKLRILRLKLLTLVLIQTTVKKMFGLKLNLIDIDGQHETHSEIHIDLIWNQMKRSAQSQIAITNVINTDQFSGKLLCMKRMSCRRTQFKIIHYIWHMACHDSSQNIRAQQQPAGTWLARCYITAHTVWHEGSKFLNQH